MPDTPTQKKESTQPTSRRTVTYDQLKELIAEVTAETIKSEIESAIAPLQQQQTDWMGKIRASQLISPAQKKKGIGVARLFRVFAAANGDTDRAAALAKKWYDDDLGDSIVKALGAQDFAGGGFLIEQEFAAELIELLRPAVAVRAAGPRPAPLSSGSLSMRRRTGSSSAQYVGESQDIPASQPTGGQLVLTAKKLAALVPISNDLLRYAPGSSADEFIRDDIVDEIAEREDIAFLRDDGTNNTPRGLRYWAPAANLIAQSGTDLPSINADVRDLVEAQMGSNVKMRKPAWIMSSRSRNHLMFNVLDADNKPFFAAQVAAGQFVGWPLFITNNIPNNLGGGTESEIYLVDMSQAILGEDGTIEIAISNEASYLESGTLVSSFSRDETVVRAIERHDFVMRHAAAVSILTGVTWGV